MDSGAMAEANPPLTEPVVAGAAPRAASGTRTGRPRRAWSPELSGTTGLLLAAPFLAMLALYVVYPFVALVRAALGPPGGIQNVQIFFANKANLNIVFVTFRDALIVTAIVFILGSLLAWALRSTKSRVIRVVVLMAIFMPLWMGSVVKIYAISVFLGRQGIINTVLQQLGLIDAPLALLYTQGAVIAGMVYQLLPYGVLPMYVAFSTIDPDLVLAAESLGASRVRALANIVLPLAIPGILAALVINFVLALGFYLTPVLLGGATQPFTATLIQEDLFTYFDVAGASIGGLVLLVMGGLAVAAGYLLVGKDRLRRAITA
jgi:ABC-type spermidine/putrescine transport system permease subunit I